MSVETQIYTIRHAHTNYNAEKRYAGTIDIALSEKGLQEAQKAATQLENLGYHFDIVVSSEMKRSIQTAELLIKYPVEFIQSQLCNERKFGVMEGHTWDEVQNFNPPILFINVGNDLHSVNPQKGEYFEDVWMRAKKFRRYLFRQYPGKKILVISHGVFLQMFHGVLKGGNCIESLGLFPSNLELSSFNFLGNKLIGFKTQKLLAMETGTPKF